MDKTSKEQRKHEIQELLELLNQAAVVSHFEIARVLGIRVVFGALEGLAEGNGRKGSRVLVI